MTGIATPAWAIGADSHSANLVRMAQQGLLGGTGVVGEGGQVKAVSGKLEVKVEPFQIYIPGTLGISTAVVNSGNQHATYSALPEHFTTQGSYSTYLAEALNLSVSSPSPSHERIDLVVAKIEDAEWAGSLNQAALAIVTGTPEASPKAPAPPANSVVLAQYKVPVGATEITAGNITDERPHVNAVSAGAWTSLTAEPNVTPATFPLQAPAARLEGTLVRLRGAYSTVSEIKATATPVVFAKLPAALVGSAIENVTGLVVGTGTSTRLTVSTTGELAVGEVTLPAGRAIYLDDVSFNRS